MHMRKVWGTEQMVLETAACEHLFSYLDIYASSINCGYAGIYSYTLHAFKRQCTADS